jgi:hypothetical protein
LLLILMLYHYLWHFFILIGYVPLSGRMLVNDELRRM